MAPFSNDHASVEHLKHGSQPAASTGRFVEAGGLRLHYLDYGSGNKTHHENEGRPPMLCVHGGAAHGHWFDYIAPYFSSDYHVRALDQRGHGNSDWVDPPAYSYQDYASDLAQVAEKLDLRDFVLIGHSMGGMVSLVYAATYPGRVGKLVIVDTSMKLNEERIAAMRDRGSRPGSSYATREELITRLSDAASRHTGEPRSHSPYGRAQCPTVSRRHLAAQVRPECLRHTRKCGRNAVLGADQDTDAAHQG